MAGRKKESQIQKAAQQILEKRGVDFNYWKKEVINKRKLAVMSDEDKDWTERTIDEEALSLVMEHISSDKANSNHNNFATVSHN